ncbi:hypothetical protein [Streptomyces uncialis]
MTWAWDVDEGSRPGGCVPLLPYDPDRDEAAGMRLYRRMAR